MISYSFLVILLVQFLSVHGANLDWNYGSAGPDAWPFLADFSKCGGLAQSPIDIITSQALPDKSLVDIIFNNYNQNIKFKLQIQSYTVTAFPDYTNVASKPTISGSNYPSSFELLQFHFHWGQNNFQGSEHEINGKKFPMELHLVHINSAGQLAVLGFLFNISTETNSELNSFVSASKKIPKDRTNEVTLNLASLIPSQQSLNNNGYYRYSGSLTTPPCSEIVIWTVFNSYLPVAASYLEDLRSIEPINFREPQPLSSRPVYKSVALGSDRPKNDCRNSRRLRRGINKEDNN